MSERDAPDGLEVNPTGAIVAPWEVNFYRAEPITKIEIYRYKSAIEHDTEAVSYGKAILFHTSDGKAFWFACHLDGPGIADDVRLSENEEVIRELLKGSALRLSIIYCRALINRKWIRYHSNQ